MELIRAAPASSRPPGALREVGWLKLPLRKRAIDDFEPDRQPFNGPQRSGCIRSALNDHWLPQAENNLGLDFQRTWMCKRERSGVPVTVVHRVVVHVRPSQRFKFEYPPHRLVRISNFQADGSRSSTFAEFLERCFNLVSRIEIEPRALGRRNTDHLSRLKCRQKLLR